MRLNMLIEDCTEHVHLHSAHLTCKRIGIRYQKEKRILVLTLFNGVLWEILVVTVGAMLELPLTCGNFACQSQTCPDLPCIRKDCFGRHHAWTERL